jgi:hypothetical protein
MEVSLEPGERAGGGRKEPGRKGWKRAKGMK